jgi:hypothetical protein
MRWDNFKLNSWISAQNRNVVTGGAAYQSHRQPTDVYVHSAYAIIRIRL